MCHIARVIVLVFIFFLQFQIVSNTIRMHALDVHCIQLCFCSSKSFQISPECMLQRHCFLCSSNSFQIPPEVTLFSFFFSAVPNRFKYLQSAYFKEIVYYMFSVVPNRFKYRQNACFKYIVFMVIGLNVEKTFSRRQFKNQRIMFSIFELILFVFLRRPVSRTPLMPNNPNYKKEC